MNPAAVVHYALVASVPSLQFIDGSSERKQLNFPRSLTLNIVKGGELISNKFRGAVLGFRPAVQS